MCTSMCIDMCTDMCTDMHTETFGMIGPTKWATYELNISTRVQTCAYVHRRVYVCPDMCADVCIDIAHLRVCMRVYGDLVGSKFPGDPADWWPI